MLMASRRRGGWTRAEALVIGLVCVVVFGLVVTIIFRSHEPAQRIQCADNLRNQGTAIRLYHENHRSLPASCIAPGYATWVVQVAGFLPRDNGKAVKPWDLTRPYYEQTQAVREGQVWDYFCPVRRLPPQLSVGGETAPAGKWKMQHLPGALGDYGCASGTDDPARSWTTAEADGAIIPGEVLERDGDRIVRWQSRTSLKALERGEAYTILIGEKHVVQGDFGQTIHGDGSIYNGDHPASFARTVGKDHALAQGPTAPFNNNFGSWHPGVCQFVMADGSLRVFANNLSPEALAKLVPRALPPGDAPK